MQLGLRTTDILVGKPYTHTLSLFLIFSTFPLKLLIPIIQLGRLCIFLIFITKFLVGALEFKMEFRGLYPVNYFYLSSSPRTGTMVTCPCEFLDRVQVRMERTQDTVDIVDGGVGGSEFP